MFSANHGRPGSVKYYELSQYVAKRYQSMHRERYTAH